LPFVNFIPFIVILLIERYFWDWPNSNTWNILISMDDAILSDEEASGTLGNKA
jgi:hypothetical protein